MRWSAASILITNSRTLMVSFDAERWFVYAILGAMCVACSRTRCKTRSIRAQAGVGAVSVDDRDVVRVV